MDSATVTEKRDVEMTTRTESLRSGPGSPREDTAIVELAGLDEDLVTRHEVPERTHHRFRRFSEHSDDDAIVGSHSSTSGVEGQELTRSSGRWHRRRDAKKRQAPSRREPGMDRRGSPAGAAPHGDAAESSHPCAPSPSPRYLDWRERRCKAGPQEDTRDES